MMPMDIVNRRRAQRSMMDCLVHLRSRDDPEGGDDRFGHDSIAQDISATGMRVWADRYFPPDSEAVLTFECEKAGVPRAISCVVSIAWADSEPVEGRWQLGVRFGDDEASRYLAGKLSNGCLWCEKLCPEIAAPAIAAPEVPDAGAA